MEFVIAAIEFGPLTFRFCPAFGLGKILKNESKRPCVVPDLALASFLAPFLTLSSLKFLSPHRYFTRPSSFGLLHFS